jgi:hypothetical protein
VKRNRTLPFWQHPALVPLEGNSSDVTANSSHAAKAADDDDDEQEPSGEASDEDDTENIVDMEATPWECDGGTYRERLVDNIKTIRDFCGGLEYQLQFEDRRMLETLEREGASFLRMAKACLSRERRSNTTRGTSPTTWDPATSSAMFYRTRPCRKDVDT